VLKVAHHGSPTSSSAAFLRAAKPEISVISSGAFNRYGHPAPGVLQRLNDIGTRVVRLDRSGGTVVTGDGKAVVVETWKP
jgi:competence protein ComEC